MCIRDRRNRRHAGHSCVGDGDIAAEFAVLCGGLVAKLGGIARRGDPCCAAGVLLLVRGLRGGDAVAELAAVGGAQGYGSQCVGFAANAATKAPPACQPELLARLRLRRRKIAALQDRRQLRSKTRQRTPTRLRMALLVPVSRVS